MHSAAAAREKRNIRVALMAIGSSRLTHGGADILHRPALLDQVDRLRPALLSAQLKQSEMIGFKTQKLIH